MKAQRPDHEAPPTEVLGERASPPGRLKLVVLSGPCARRELPLPAGSFTVGKGPENDLVLEDGAVSRRHLELSVLPGRVRLRDLGSTNGSFCRGARFQEMEATAGSIIQVGRTELKVSADESPAAERESLCGLRGRSEAMRAVFSLIERVAPTSAGVLIEGETGTGKELCAQALHELSPRAKGPFVVVDLAGIQPNLIESELFGHLRGAFTGATADRAGAFEEAHGGTLFLDEIGELALELQPRLLRALEKRQTKRLGANQYRQSDVRVIAATHRDLAAEIGAGRFRRDLFHRLAVVRITMPPLRARPEDIPLLVEHHLREMGHPWTLEPEVMAQLCARAWPGNVRELRNVLERIGSLGERGALDAGLDGAMLECAEPARGSLPVAFKEAKEQLVSSFERDYLEELLERCDHNITRVAREAGLDRVSVYRLLKKHGLA